MENVINFDLLKEYDGTLKEVLKVWQKEKSYSIDDIIQYKGNYLKCTTAGTTGTITLDFTGLGIGDTITDGTVVWEIIEPPSGSGNGFIVEDSAPAHNALYREKDLTDYFNSGQMSNAIANGSFEDIFPGDYIIKSVTVNGTAYDDVKWIVGTLDYFLHNGDIECTTHHVLLFPETLIGTAQMNSGYTTSGGYVGSSMWATTIPLYVTGIINAFGIEHVLSHREMLTTNVDDGVRSSALYSWSGATDSLAWQDVIVNLFNENMVYGGAQFSSSGYDTADCNHQVQAMRHNRQVMLVRSIGYWLRSVASSNFFCYCQGTGIANCSPANMIRGVRPYFLLY